MMIDQVTPSHSQQQGGSSPTISGSPWVAEISTSFPVNFPSSDSPSDELLKEWVWGNCKDQILAGITVRRDGSTQTSKIVKERELDHSDSATVSVSSSSSSSSSSSRSDATIVKADDDVDSKRPAAELEEYRKRLELLERVAQIQKQYLQSEGPKVVYGHLLDGILDLVDSEFGYIGEARFEDDGTMYLYIHASTNIAWDDVSRKFFEETKNMRFYNMDTLFGRVLTHGELVISNDPKNDSRSYGVPKGHPVIESFMGIPLFKENGDILGLFAVANKPGGYCEADASYLEPFKATSENLIQAYYQIEKNNDLIDTLEEKVEERTRKLVVANLELEQANQRVLRASAVQLQHFASMSHEIRTPLNCIIGLLSLLQESNLTPMQQESMRMIVNSGELLVTVVNDVLDYSKLESGNVDIEMSRTNLQEALESTVHSIATKAQTKNINLKTVYDYKLPKYIECDERRLQQVLFNLMGNALKFSKEWSSIELHVEVCQPSHSQSGYTYVSDIDDIDTSPGTKQLSIESSKPKRNSKKVYSPPSFATGAAGCPFTRMKSASAKEDPASVVYSTVDYQPSEELSQDCAGKTSSCPMLAGKDQKQTKVKDPDPVLRFVVKDYGKGIDRSEFQAVFRPFRQASAETERLYGGTGLGLAITTKLVQAMGGTISVDSEVGKWTTFTVDLPFKEEVVDTNRFSSQLKDTRAVIISGNSDDSDYLSWIFEKYGVRSSLFGSMKAMEDALISDLSPNSDESFVCLVDEDLYVDESYQLLSELRTSVLLTYGKRFDVGRSSDHYRSIRQVLPSALMETIAKCMKTVSKSGLQPKRRSLSSNSLKALGCNPYSHLRVLVAEDNIVNQKVISKLLQRIGVENFDVANDGAQAVKAEATTAYDIILMDMQMPVMDGLEACRRIMGRPNIAHPKPRVIFATANAANSYEALCKEAGGSGFLPKPFNIAQVEKCLSDALQDIEESRPWGGFDDSHLILESFDESHFDLGGLMF